MTLALLCSGQGNQHAGMFDLFATEAAAQPAFAAAAQQLGQDPRAWLPKANLHDLQTNRVGQLLCVTGALAAARALALPRFVTAGYSVGEMAAWGCANVWDDATVLALTARRAELMDAADAEGGLGFVRGLARPSLEALVHGCGCAVAIVNPDGLFIVGGHRAAVAALCEQARAQGATLARPLAVHVASHTPRLAAAVAPFLQLLRAQKTRTPPASGPSLLGAATASLVQDPLQALPGLANQLATTIDWAALLAALVERGVHRVLEVGAGDALAAMVRRAYPQVQARALQDFRSLQGARNWALAPA